MKIVLVHNYYQQRGGEDVVFEQERDLLRRAGDEVVEYCRTNEEVIGSPLLERIAAVPTTIWSQQSCTTFLRLLARERPDIVHVHNTFFRISPSSSLSETAWSMEWASVTWARLRSAALRA